MLHTSHSDLLDKTANENGRNDTAKANAEKPRTSLAHAPDEPQTYPLARVRNKLLHHFPNTLKDRMRTGAHPTLPSK